MRVEPNRELLRARPRFPRAGYDNTVVQAEHKLGAYHRQVVDARDADCPVYLRVVRILEIEYQNFGRLLQGTRVPPHRATVVRRGEKFRVGLGRYPFHLVRYVPGKVGDILNMKWGSDFKGENK